MTPSKWFRISTCPELSTAFYKRYSTLMFLLCCQRMGMFILKRKFWRKDFSVTFFCNSTFTFKSNQHFIITHRCHIMKSIIHINFVTLRLTRPDILQYKDWRVMLKVISLVTLKYWATWPNSVILFICHCRTNSKLEIMAKNVFPLYQKSWQGEEHNVNWLSTQSYNSYYGPAFDQIKDMLNGFRRLLRLG